MEGSHQDTLLQQMMEDVIMEVRQPFISSFSLRLIIICFFKTWNHFQIIYRFIKLFQVNPNNLHVYWPISSENTNYSQSSSHTSFKNLKIKQRSWWEKNHALSILFQDLTALLGGSSEYTNKDNNRQLLCIRFGPRIHILSQHILKDCT